MVVRPLRMGPPCLLAALQVIGGHVAIDAEFTARDADQHLILDHHRGRRAGLAFRWIAILRLPDHLPVLGVERYERGIGLMQEDLAVSVSEAAIDRVAAHDGNNIWILLGLVFPEDLGVVLQVERVDRVGERPVDVHHVADYEGPAFMATQNTSRERPCHLQFADIVGGDLLELGVALVGIVSCRHHPIFGILRHFDEIIVGMSSARNKDRYGAHACGEQEIAHRYPPYDSTAGDRRKSTCRAASRTHPMGSALGGVGNLTLALTPRPAYEETSAFPLS